MPPYIKEGGGGAAGPLGVRLEESYSPGSRTPPSCLGGEGKGGGERGKGGAAPLPCPIRTRGEGARGLPWPALLFSLMAHSGPLTTGRGPVTPRCSGKIPILPGTFPMSKHRLPIYQSSCLNHFETPCHVRSHIRDSEQPSVHQNIQTHNITVIVR